MCESSSENEREEGVGEKESQWKREGLLQLCTSTELQNYRVDFSSCGVFKIVLFFLVFFKKKKKKDKTSFF